MMGNRNYRHEEIAVPKLGEAIKKKNGVSSRRLQECIEILHAALEDHEPEQVSEKDSRKDNLDDIGQDN